jgi:hypothetical protein
MPCPFFEPRKLASNPRSAQARLPLLDEYDGVCHAMPEPASPPEALRFERCNHGYSRQLCQFFLPSEQRSCLRYHVLRAEVNFIEVLLISEQDYAPVHWQPIRYWRNPERLDPELNDVCAKAQLQAFCRSYIRRTKEGPGSIDVL